MSFTSNYHLIHISFTSLTHLFHISVTYPAHVLFTNGIVAKCANEYFVAPFQEPPFHHVHPTPGYMTELREVAREHIEHPLLDQKFEENTLIGGRHFLNVRIPAPIAPNKREIVRYSVGLLR
jgi:hypothetical protein